MSAGAAQSGNKLLVKRGGGLLVEQRVPDIDAVNSQAVIERFFERQKHHHPRDQPRDAVNPAGQPGPDLGAYVIANGNSPPLSQPRKPKVETGVVYRDDHVRRLAVEFAHRPPKSARPPSRVAEGVDEPHAGVADGIGDDPHPRIGHQRPAKPGQAYVWAHFAHGSAKIRAEAVAGVFTSRNEDSWVRQHPSIFRTDTGLRARYQVVSEDK